MRTFAVGDIHGHAGKLRLLLSRLRERAAPGDALIFVGDYIDRGPDTRGVIELVMQAARGGWDGPVTTLRGNHETLLLEQFHRRPRYGLDLWLRNGGEETLASYGVPRLNRRWKEAIPREHLDFLSDLQFWHEDEHGIYVHGGLMPGFHPSELEEETLLWIREPFISSPYRWEKVVVFGHTPQHEEGGNRLDLDTVVWRPLNRPEKIGLDTGAGYGGPLTAVQLPEREFISVEQGSE